MRTIQNNLNATVTIVTETYLAAPHNRTLLWIYTSEHLRAQSKRSTATSIKLRCSCNACSDRSCLLSLSSQVMTLNILTHIILYQYCTHHSRYAIIHSCHSKLFTSSECQEPLLRLVHHEPRATTSQLICRCVNRSWVRPTNIWQSKWCMRGACYLRHRPGCGRGSGFLARVL